jgi:hypothetical protein
MAYQLQPNLIQVENPAVPPVCATETIVAPPQPTSLNYCCRPNTMLYGTAPFMAGKGAPNELIMVDDELRPQATTRFDRVYVDNTSRDYFPIQDMRCSVPLRSMSYDPASTRSQVQNGLFTKRYCYK